MPQTENATAAAHIAAVRARCPGAVAVDDSLWIVAVVAHLEPLPADRPWRLLTARHRPSPVGQLAPHVARGLTPPAGTRPPVECPVWCRAMHREAA